MSKPFWDQYNFLHDTESATSNNPLIYSAFWRALTGEIIDYNDVYFTDMLNHKVLGNDISITRSPSNDKPTSLDEIIGAISLGLIDDEFLKIYSYRWHDTLYAPKWYRVLQALIYVAGKHRNFFKDNNVRDLHPVAYWVPWHVQYYAVKIDNKRKIMPFKAAMFYLWLITLLLKRNFKNGSKQTGVISQKNIAWLILIDLSSKWWIKLIDYKKNMSDYFGSNHPLVLFNSLPSSES